MLRLLTVCAILLAPTSLAQQGTCRSGDCRSGPGVLETSRGTVYSGRFENGRLTGPVRIAYASGDTLDVPYRSGYASGTGVYRYADGRVFEGMYSNTGRNGQGTLTELDSSVHEATWDGDVRRGVGGVTYPNGDRFVGWWGGMTSFGGGVSEYRTKRWLYQWAESRSTWRATYNEGVPEPGVYRAGGDSVGVGMLDRAWDGDSPVPPPDTLTLADTSGVIIGALRADWMRRSDSTFVTSFVFEVPQPERFHATRLRVEVEADGFTPVVEWLDIRGDAVAPQDLVTESTGATWLVRVTSTEPGAVGPFRLRWFALTTRR